MGNNNKPLPTTTAQLPRSFARSTCWTKPSVVSSHIFCLSNHTTKMSWQAYIDTSLVGTGHVDKAAIISAAGDSVWAASPGFDISPAEMKVVSSIVGGDDAAKDKAFADGLYVKGDRFVMARAEDRSIYARSGRTGLAIAKTKQATGQVAEGRLQEDRRAHSAAHHRRGRVWLGR